MITDKHILWILLIILAISGFVGIFFNVYTDRACEDECSDIGAVAWQKIKSGNWAIDDMCVCYLDDEIKLVRLGE